MTSPCRVAAFLAILLTARGSVAEPPIEKWGRWQQARSEVGRGQVPRRERHDCGVIHGRREDVAQVATNANTGILIWTVPEEAGRGNPPPVRGLIGRDSGPFLPSCRTNQTLLSLRP